MRDKTLNVNDLQLIHNIAEENRKKVQDTLDKCYRYSKLHYENEMIYYPNSDTEQEKYFNDNNIIYNNVIINGLKRYAGQAQDALFPQNSHWGDIVPSTLLKSFLEKSGGGHQIKEFLEKATNMFFDYINDDKSNFHTEINNVMKDLGISTAVFYVEQGTREVPMLWKHIPIWMIEFTIDRWDKPKDIFYIEFMYPKELELLLGNQEENSKDKVKKFSYDTIDENKKLKVVHAYIRNQDNTYTRYIVSLVKGVKTILRITDFTICPFIICRMNLNSGDVYGSGIVMDNLKTIELLNMLEKRNRMLASSELHSMRLIRFDKIDKKTKVTNESGETITGVKEGNDKVPLNEIISDVKINKDIVDIILGSKQLEEELDRQLVYQPLGGVENIGKPTATESEIREKEFQEYRAGEYSRIKTEVANPIFEIGLNILFDLGLLNDLITDVLGANYDEFLEKQNMLIKMRYKSPLSKLNDRDEVTNVVNAYDMVAQRVQPLVTTAFVDQLKFAKHVFEKLGVSTEITRSDEEIENLEQEVTQDQEEQQNDPNAETN